jgi:hypothetical protein
VKLELYLSSFVQRWHTDLHLARLGQTLGHHQWGAATLIAVLHPNPSRDLLLAALTHDAGEVMTGDLPWDFKQSFPEVAEMVEEAGGVARDMMINRRLDLSETDQKWIALADALEAWLYVAVNMPERLAQGDWQHARRWLEGQAFALGVPGPVVALMREAE